MSMRSLFITLLMVFSAAVGAQTKLDLSSQVKGVLPVSNGGTGISSPGLVSGTSISISGTWPNQTVSSTGTITIAGGSTTMGTSGISSGACAPTVTAAATGVVATDVVDASFSGDPTAITGYVPSTSGMLTIIPFASVGNVNFKVCNNTGSSITPGAVTINWRVVR